MSQPAPKSQRPTLSLNAQLVGNIKKQQRSNTPSDKSNSRSSTPLSAQVEGEVVVGPQSPQKGKRRVSNDSAKVRASPKPVFVDCGGDADQKEKNGHTNGTNGAVADEKKKESVKVNEKPANGKKEKGDVEVKTPEKKKDKKESVVVVLGEKTQPEMEKLILEPDTPADSPMPKSSIGKSPGRILKYTPGGKGRISPFKTAADRLQNASTIVNLSTVSEQSTESTSAAASPAPINYDSPVKPPSGRVSGRRTTRPIKEIKMTHPQTANDSTSSTKANLGSPIHHDSLRTPIISQLIGRKRGGTTPERDESIHVDSPSKRARIDFSGFLGYVTTPITTPVTFLKNRLSRIGLTSSTPRALDVDENIADVSGMETDEAKENVSKAVEATDSVVEKEIEDIKAENAEKLTEIESGDPPTPTRRRSVCNIM